MKIIINNKSDCTLEQAAQMALQSFGTELQCKTWGWKDFIIGEKNYQCSIKPNKESVNYTIYNIFE